MPLSSSQIKPGKRATCLPKAYFQAPSSASHSGGRDGTATLTRGWACNAQVEKGSVALQSQHTHPPLDRLDLGWLVAWVSTTILRSARPSLVLALTLVTNGFASLLLFFPFFRWEYSRQGDQAEAARSRGQGQCCEEKKGGGQEACHPGR